MASADDAAVGLVAEDQRDTVAAMLTQHDEVTLLDVVAKRPRPLHLEALAHMPAVRELLRVPVWFPYHHWEYSPILRAAIARLRAILPRHSLGAWHDWLQTKEYCCSIPADVMDDPLGEAARVRPAIAGYIDYRFTAEAPPPLLVEATQPWISVNEPPLQGINPCDKCMCRLEINLLASFIVDTVEDMTQILIDEARLQELEDSLLQPNDDDEMDIM